MIPMALNQKPLLDRILVSSHRIAIDVQLLDLNHRALGNVTARLLGGQVNIDVDAADTTRSCTMELLDPQHRLALDGYAPEEGSIFGSRMVKVIYSVIQADTNFQIDIPIFCGPLTKVSRDGSVLSIEAQGKEILSMSSVWRGQNFKKGTGKLWIIRNVMQSIGGESSKYMDISFKSQARIPRPLGIDMSKTAWSLARQLASSMNMQLFYDGRGILRMRRTPSSVVYTFGEDGALLTNPKATYDMTSTKNSVLVVGGKAPRAKKKVQYRLVAPSNHALSPTSLSRNGVPRYLTEVIEDDSITTVAEARAVAQARLKVLLAQSAEIQFDSLPIPYLEERDLCKVSSTEFSGSFYLSKMTIPLTADGTSSIGYLRRVAPRSRKVSRPRRRRKKR